MEEENKKPEKTEEEKRKATLEISEKLKQAYALIRKCEDIADDNQIEFSFQVAYGMGGVYRPRKEGWNESMVCWNDDESGWSSSSMSC